MSAAATLSASSLRGATANLADELQPGRVYRREDLARLSNAVAEYGLEQKPTLAAIADQKQRLLLQCLCNTPTFGALISLLLSPINP